MRHFVCFPIANPRTGFDAVWKWQKAGYDVLFMLDKGVHVSDTLFSGTRPCLWDMQCRQDVFPGYYGVVNEMALHAFTKCGADICTFAADDMDPPTQGALEVARFYREEFGLDGYGVLQGCGDPQGMDDSGRPAAARICGSPTFGRAWAERGNGGFPRGYHSFYGDEALKEVAERCGVLRMEPSITIFHKHWSFGHQPRQDYHVRNQNDHWELDRARFMRDKITGFQEHLKEFKR